MTQSTLDKELGINKNGQLGKRRTRRRCGYCGYNVTINSRDGLMRIHGPKDNRCIGSGVRWIPVFHRSARNGGVVKRWGTCGICGDVTEYEDGTGRTKDHDGVSSKYLRLHDHERPRVKKNRETGQWTVKAVSHKTGKAFTADCETQEEATENAFALAEIMKGR